MLFMSRLGLEDEDDDGEEDMEDRVVVVFGVLGELTGERDNERAGILIFLIVGLETRCWLILVVVVLWSYSLFVGVCCRCVGWR